MGSPLAFVDKLNEGARLPLGKCLLERAEDGIILRLLHGSRGEPTVPVPGRSISRRMAAFLKCDTISVGWSNSSRLDPRPVERDACLPQDPRSWWRARSELSDHSVL